MERKSKINMPDDEMFVGILKDEESYEIRIASSLGVLQQEKRTLVYYRSFSEVLLALGYYNILQKLSISSIKSIVRKINPEEKNLSF